MREVIVPAPRLDDDGSTTYKWKWHHPVHYSFPKGWAVVLKTPLTPQAHRLFLGLLLFLGWDNQVTDSLARVGKAIGLHRNTARHALRRLEEWRLVAVDRSKPNLLRITVSPFVVWQGRPHLLYKAREAFEERCRLSARDGKAGQQHDEDNAALAAVAALPSCD